MDFSTLKHLLWAVGLGALSALSLPLGSAFGLRTRPGPMVISVMSAFGAGALLAALSVELVAPTVFALHGGGHGGHGDPHAAFYALLIGGVAGGLIYFLLDQAVSTKGGFLRRTASTIAQIRRDRRREQQEILQKLSRFPLLHELSAELVEVLLTRIRPVKFRPGEVLVREGDHPRDALLVLEGEVEFKAGDGFEAKMKPGYIVNAGVLVAGTPVLVTATASGAVEALALARPDFEALRQHSEAFDRACREQARQGLEMLDEWVSVRNERARDWIHKTASALVTGSDLPDAIELRMAREEHGGSPLAIWLGILIDGIPESFVIGAGLLVSLAAAAGRAGSLVFWDIVPYTLIAGLFLSNFPEALASSANMRRQGWSKGKVFWLWLSLMIITALGSGAGFILAESLSPSLLVFAEGVAAGAMLTMIASAMIPEAVHLGSAHAVGLSTLAGFLAAISFKLLE
jgi:zinc transporter ZupT